MLQSMQVAITSVVGVLIIGYFVLSYFSASEVISAVVFRRYRLILALTFIPIALWYIFYSIHLLLSGSA